MRIYALLTSCGGFCCKEMRSLLTSVALVSEILSCALLSVTVRAAKNLDKHRSTFWL